MFFLKKLPTRQMTEHYGALYPEMDVDLVEDALLMMRKASLLIRELDAYFKSYDLSLLRFLILMVIDREPGRTSLSLGEIGARVDVSKPVMTRTIKALVSDDLITVAQDSEDKRSKFVALTKKGVVKLETVLPEYFALITQFMGSQDE
ncbi:MarR family winged helix-turn-helix transcriptional regulator [Litorimonas sp.]|uniref:MarR family winged helix-turn-helix transcriptional regulator n=1 Tax=Litorimonas sp. TaxID=1892381 RepID=UPI003A845A0F